MYYRFIGTLLLFTLTACGQSPYYRAPSAPQSAGDTSSVSSPPQVITPTEVETQNQQMDDNPAIVALLARSDQLSDAGESDAAIASAERALRLSPRSPEIYYRLAKLRVQRHEWPQAEQMALKATSLRPTAELKNRIEILLERIRSQLRTRG